jgi:hypothetical protein
MLIKSVSQRSSVQTSLQEVAMEEKRPESEDGSDRSTGRNITLQGRAVEENKIRRYLKSKARLDSRSIELKRLSNDERLALGGPVLAFTNSM